MRDKAFFISMLFSVLFCSETKADLIILDDFNDFESPSLLEGSREIYDEDFSGRIGNLGGRLDLYQTVSPEPATLLYSGISNVDLQGIRQIVLDEFTSFPFDGSGDLTATLQVGGTTTVNGVLSDGDGMSPQMIFNLGTELFSTDELRFDFSSSNEPLVIASSRLYGTVQAIPEPSSLMLATVAAVASGFVFRRKLASSLPRN